MARQYLMTWVAKQKRWTKMYRGERHYVSCRQLGTAETKEASWKKANEWWSGKLAEAGTVSPKMSVTDPDGGRPSEGTVGGLFERWVTIQHVQAVSGEITPDRADNNRIALVHFRDFLGSEARPATMNETRLHDFYLHCLGKLKARSEDPKRKDGWSPSYAQRVFATARWFVKFAWENGLIDLPRNHDSRSHRFNVAPKRLTTITVEEFRSLVVNATSQLELHLLLMANCGMTQTDISDLRQDEVDWRLGRVTRKRSKTRDAKDVPLVSYPLWGGTFELLKKYRSSDETYVLLTESGRPWVRKVLKNGRLEKSDNIASCYAHLRRKTGISKSMKLIRKTSATLIESHREYGRYKSHFLGHSPRGVTERNYAAPDGKLFDEIVVWLGERYGVG